MNLMPKILPLLLPPKCTEKATWNHLDTALSSMIQPQKPQGDGHLLPALHYPSRGFIGHVEQGTTIVL